MPSKAAGSMLLVIVATGLFLAPCIQADSLGRLESVSSSDGYTERQIDYTYNDVGNLLARTSTLSTTDTGGDLLPDTWEQQYAKIDVPVALHHEIARGINRQRLFQDDLEYLRLDFPRQSKRG